MISFYKNKKEDLIAKFSDFIDIFTERKYLFRIFAFGLLFNILIWSLLLFAKSYVQYFFELIGWIDFLNKIVFLIIFFVGFIMIYSILRLISQDSEIHQIDSNIMSGYSNQLRSEKIWLTWIITGMLSAFHTIIYYFLAITSV